MIDLKKIQFGTDKGTVVKFKFVAPPPLDLEAEIQLSTFDMKGSDRFHFALGQVRDGIDKIVYGPTQSLKRRLNVQSGDDASQSEAINIGLEAITFGSDDDGYFATFTMLTGLKNFNESGSMKLPKAYYDREERNFNLFPAEDHEDLAVLKREAEEMIGNYLRQLGNAFSRMLIDTIGKEGADLIDRLRETAPAAVSKATNGAVILNIQEGEKA